MRMIIRTASAFAKTFFRGVSGQAAAFGTDVIYELRCNALLSDQVLNLSAVMNGVVI